MANVRVLVVEDEGIAAELIQGVLRNLGHEVCAVTAYGEEAVEKALGLRPDIILMDIKLRGRMSGFEAAERIRESLDVPVVYLTAFADDETLSRVKMTQPFGYLQKPFRSRELQLAIEIAMYRHDMERQLKEREHSYRVLADNLPGMLYRLCLADRVVHLFNHMHEVITGYRAGELTAGALCPIDAIMASEDREEVTAKVRTAIDANLPFAVEYRIRHKNGDLRHVTEHGRPVYAGDGRALHIDGMIFDVTERRRMEGELRRAHATLAERKIFIESVIANIQSGILVTDLRMRVTLANPYVQRLCNHRCDEIVGRHLGVIFPEIDARIAEGVDADEIPMQCGASELVVGFSRCNLRGFDRAVVGHIINFKDLTENVRIRREMRQKERLSTMGEVVARVAHEMRNPLFAMTAVGQILDMELPLEPPHKELMDSFLREARRLNNLVEELLDSTRVLRLSRKEVNLLKVIDASIHVCDLVARERDVAIEKVLPPRRILLQADPEKLEQVVLNLLKNAIEASDAGTTVRLVVESDSNSVILRVIDSGHGIREELFDSIFDVFYTTKKNGTGMGLSISRNIVEAHGGSLTASNNPERGATFTMILPWSGATGHEIADH
jgi:PAS domain S-box-containing protein